MVVKWWEGFDVVFAVCSKCYGEIFFKKFIVVVYYRLLWAMLGGIFILVDVGDFRLMSWQVVLTMWVLCEQHCFVCGMVVWVGFWQVVVIYERLVRFVGETKYSLSKMLRFVIDGIILFSTVFLWMVIWLGVVMGCLSLVGGLWAVWVKLFNCGVVFGWTTIMILVGMGSFAQLLMIGILGEYVGRIYEEVKCWFLYVVREEINLELGMGVGQVLGRMGAFSR